MSDLLDHIPTPALTLGEPSSFKDTALWIRPYVQALFDFCRIVDPQTGAEVPLIFATPERPYAAQISQLIRDGKVFPPGALPLPAMSLSFVDAVFDDARAHSWQFRRLGFDRDARHVWTAPYPEPYNLLFQLDMRSKYNNEVWRMMQQYQTKFRRGAWCLTVDMGPFGIQQFIRVETSGPRDASDLEPGDDRERTIRKSISLTVYGWLVLPATKVRTIRAASIDLQDPRTEEIYGTSRLEFPDGHAEEEP